MYSEEWIGSFKFLVMQTRAKDLTLTHNRIKPSYSKNLSSLAASESALREEPLESGFKRFVD